MRPLTLALIATLPLIAERDFTVYELLAPDSHKSSIVYDTATSEEGSAFYLNPIRRGSVASGERVIDRATGKELTWETVDGKTAKQAGLRPAASPDDQDYLKVKLASPVPKNGEARIRIFKVYEDAKSYYASGQQIVFERGLGIRRNVVILPAGYELIGSSVPVTVSVQPDDRVRIGMLNDRQDELPVKLIGRRLP
jgi:hypothetical protein